jgi:hypothetical protein
MIFGGAFQFFCLQLFNIKCDHTYLHFGQINCASKIGMFHQADPGVAPVCEVPRVE